MMSWDRLDSKLRPSWVLLRQRQNRFWGPSRNPDPVFGRQEKRAVFGPKDGCELVELSGYCPPSPSSLTGAFSRLSLEFVLIERTPRSVAYRSLQILVLARASNHARVPARVDDRKAEWFGPTLRVR